MKYNIFGLIPKTSYVTQTLNIKYRGTIESRAILVKKIYDVIKHFKGLVKRNQKQFISC